MIDRQYTLLLTKVTSHSNKVSLKMLSLQVFLHFIPKRKQIFYMHHLFKKKKSFLRTSGLYLQQIRHAATIPDMGFEPPARTSSLRICGGCSTSTPRTASYSSTFNQLIYFLFFFKIKRPKSQRILQLNRDDASSQFTAPTVLHCCCPFAFV